MQQADLEVVLGGCVRLLSGEHIGRRARVVAIHRGVVVAQVLHKLDGALCPIVELHDGDFRPTSSRGARRVSS